MRRHLQIGAWILLAISFASNVYLMLLLVDAGVILDNTQTKFDQLWNRRKEALTIINHAWVGRSATDLEELANELKDHGIKVSLDGDAREIGDFLFEVEDGVVTEVRDLDSTH